ncbi:YveK family protein [Lachnoclostridium sp. Marseille-P6806]|uniref:YveK family protein n=1 Tax=Lachnoclostridium sp. Marseille-P6806 TaxID=2364793 RepID=UPI0010316BE9|nr:hypothetical protein [Lachnoclostridium sp. Marseille-P6806]
MTRHNLRYGTEELNQRVRYLRVLHGLWLVPAGAGFGALLCFLAYFLVTTVFSGVREYEYVSKLYVEYAVNEDTQTAYDYYNGWTWTDLLTANPAISDTIEENLPEGASLDTVREEVKAAILSDIRVMTVTVTDHSPARAEAIGAAVNSALEHFGAGAKEFDRITVMSVRGPSMLVYSNRTKNAILLGLFLGALTGAGVLLLRETVNDAVYVPEDAERRYGVPVLGLLCAKEGQSLTAEWEREIAANLARLKECGENGRPPVLVRLPAFSSGSGASGGRSEAAGRRPAGTEETGTALPELRADEYAALREAGAVVLALPFGVRCGAAADHLFSVLRQQGCPVQAIALDRADMKFIHRYYRCCRGSLRRSAGTDTENGAVKGERVGNENTGSGGGG